MSDRRQQSRNDPLVAGQQALARGDWREARACFEEAVVRAATPQALEGLGMAAWWLYDATATFDARERAYRLYRERGDRCGAARLATCLALDHYAFHGNYAVANGWLQRAQRLLENLAAGAEHAMLALCQGHLALLVKNDAATARRRGGEASALARSLNLIDLEMQGRALQGLALVSEGHVTEGMLHLDEATTAAVGGEMGDLDAITTTCCYLIYACERVRDYDRAAQWCETVKRITVRWSYRLMFSLCRTHYAGVLMWQGAWREAEDELVAATTELEATHPAMAAEGIVRLAELRRRQGRLEDAAALLQKAELRPFRMLGTKPALLGRAALALDEGDAATACDLCARLLRGLRPEDRLERLACLEVLLRASIALGHVEKAAATLVGLRSIATAVGTEPLLASAAVAEGLVAAAVRDYETARDRLEDAVDLFDRSAAPLEAAQARLELARVLGALGRAGAAEREARAALASFQGLGAALASDRAAAFLQEQIPIVERPSQQTNPAGLTTRELDVLRLVAAARSNQEIAAHLVVSVRTVERHISTIYEKVGARGKVARAAATAYALNQGLVGRATT